MAGVFIDGFAHSNLRNTIEDFFTPWHAILYSGFTATALSVLVVPPAIPNQVSTE